MEIGADGWRDVIDVNLTGVYYTVEAANPTMVEQGDGGAIVLISSSAGLVGRGSHDAGRSVTPQPKRNCWVDARICEYFAPHSIRVNSLHPAGVDTPMINNEFIPHWLN